MSRYLPFLCVFLHKSGVEWAKLPIRVGYVSHAPWGTLHMEDNIVAEGSNKLNRPILRERGW